MAALMEFQGPLGYYYCDVELTFTQKQEPQHTIFCVSKECVYTFYRCYIQNIQTSHLNKSNRYEKNHGISVCHFCLQAKSNGSHKGLFVF